MYTKRYKKKDKNPYVIYKGNINALIQKYKNLWSQNTTSGGSYIQILSIDPATDNCGIDIERRYGNGTIDTLLLQKVNLNEYKKIPFGDLASNVFDENETNIYVNCNAYLDSLQSYFLEMNWIIIEQQHPSNYATVRLSQHMISYFLIKCPHCVIMDVDSHLKSSQLGIPKGLPQNELKKLTVGMVVQFMIQYQDHNGLKFINEYRRQHDIADAKAQVEALCKYLYIDIKYIQNK